MVGKISLKIGPSWIGKCGGFTITRTPSITILHNTPTKFTFCRLHFWWCWALIGTPLDLSRICLWSHRMTVTSH